MVTSCFLKKISQSTKAGIRDFDILRTNGRVVFPVPLLLVVFERYFFLQQMHVWNAVDVRNSWFVSNMSHYSQCPICCVCIRERSRRNVCVCVCVCSVKLMVWVCGFCLRVWNSVWFYGCGVFACVWSCVCVCVCAGTCVGHSEH